MDRRQISTGEEHAAAPRRIEVHTDAVANQDGPH